MSSSIEAQDYEISFSGFGDSIVIDSLLVENLTQETILTLDGSDILNLVGTLSIDNSNENEVEVKIYPNPIKGTGRLVLFSALTEEVEINIFDLTGKLISIYTDKVYPGNNTYKISNYSSGIYIANISTNTWQKSLKFISQGSITKSADIKLISRKQSQNLSNIQLKNSANMVQMQYNDGDQLLIKGFSADNITYFSIVPTQTQNINIEFSECIDANGNKYPVVNIGNQTWMAKNLEVFPPVQPQPSGEWCYDSIENNCNIYGRLYDWYTLTNGEGSSNNNQIYVQGLCPQGWHIPNDDEWTQLTDFLGGLSIAGGKMKSTFYENWIFPNIGATNSSGFSGIPGGFLDTDPIYGGFENIGISGVYWSSTEDSSYTTDAWIRSLHYDDTGVFREPLPKTYAYSCRCIRD